VVNIQSSHFAQVVGSSLSAAVPLNIIKTFALSGICVIAGEGILRCQLKMEKVRWILVQFSLEIPGCDERSDAASEDDEIQGFQKEVAALLYDTEE
jgi:hypothetical protein